MKWIRRIVQAIQIRRLVRPIAETKHITPEQIDDMFQGITGRLQFELSIERIEEYLDSKFFPLGEEKDKQNGD